MASFAKLCRPGILSKHRLSAAIRCFSLSSSTHGQNTVGFIGLGNMGGHMAKNLIKKGYPVIAFDVVPDNLSSVVQAGGEAASSPAEVASKVDTLVTMLPSNPHVRSVYTGDAGVLSSVQKGSLLIDSSTIDPAVSQEVAALAKEKGADYMDAPVSGGVNAARDGILTFMVGGEESRFEQCKSILDNMGKNVVYCGGVGTGEAAKICNNMLLAISMIGVSETMNLGMRLGLDPKMLAKILNMSSGRCWSSDTYNPVPGVIEGVPSSNDYQGGFGTALMTKDLGLAQDAATATKSPTPLGSAAHQIYRIMTQAGYDGKDFSSAYQFLKEKE